MLFLILSIDTINITDAAKISITADMRKAEALATKLASPDVHLVVEAYEHALLAVHPKKRYVVGRDAHMLIFLALLPEVVLDTVFLKKRKVLPKVLMDKYH